MDPLVEEIEGIFRRELPGSEPALETLAPSTKVSGYLVWDGFDGKEQTERQSSVRRVMRQYLAPEDLVRVSLVLTLTPHEWVETTGTQVRAAAGTASEQFQPAGGNSA